MEGASTSSVMRATTARQATSAARPAAAIQAMNWGDGREGWGAHVGRAREIAAEVPAEQHVWAGRLHVSSTQSLPSTREQQQRTCRPSRPSSPSQLQRPRCRRKSRSACAQFTFFFCVKQRHSTMMGG